MVKEQYGLSIANALWKYGKKVNNDLVPIFHVLPEQFQVPSIYFPDAEIISDRDTLSTFIFTYSLNAKIFATTNEGAFMIATNIQRELALSKWRVPILNQDGTETGEYITVKKPSEKKGDELVAIISIAWDERCYYDT